MPSIIQLNLYPSKPEEIPFYSPRSTAPSISFYPALNAIAGNSGAVGGCVVVFPGGGYSGLADYEGHDVALALNERGIAAYVLRYRTTGNREQSSLHPAPLCDALSAVAYARAHARKFGYASDKIAVMGFSAGGHLAVTASEQFDYFDDEDDNLSFPALDPILCRPDALIACYAVVSMGMYTHVGSRHNLIGTSDALSFSLSGELSVRADMPPAFIWHTADDNCVPVENSLLLARGMSDAHVPFELHVFPHGSHGMGLANGTDVSRWFPLAVEFLRSRGF